MKKVSRKHFLAGVAGLGIAWAGYGWSESVRLKLSRHEVKLAPEWAPSLKLLHLSDLHATNNQGLDLIEEAVEMGLAEQPDMVCLTGDFITRTYDHFDKYSGVLSKLSAVAPVYACLGNHDGGNWARRHLGYRDSSKVSEMLLKGGIELLLNRKVEICIKGRRLKMAGTGDPWANSFNPSLALDNAPAQSGTPCILLTHNPDNKDKLRKWPWDLLLCGHTHGGQVSIPFIGEPFAPVKDKRFIAGLYRWEDRWIHITKGIGSVLNMRFNCRPEVSVITLT